MRRIPFLRVEETIKLLCIEAAHRLPDDVTEALEKAQRSETHEHAKRILQLMLENAELASRRMVPLCQDTGVAVIFVEQGNQVTVEPSPDDPDSGLIEAINAGVAAGFEEGFLRRSIVSDPVNERRNTDTNTPAVVHHRFVGGDRLKLTVMLKGGGCENRSRFHMLTPAQGQTAVEGFVVETVRQAGADACPPFIVGVGIGGDFELACLLAKQALLRPLNSAHPEPFYADMERRLLQRINRLGIGPQGMGGATTALAVLIETHPCHIASLPVAVNIECHSHRHRSAII